MSDEMMKAIIRWRVQQEDLTLARLASGEIDYPERDREFALIHTMAEKAAQQREEAMALGDESHLADYIVVLEARIAYLEDIVKKLIELPWPAKFEPPESRPFWLFLQ